jgi:hypothetical protein
MWRKPKNLKRLPRIALIVPATEAFIPQRVSAPRSRGDHQRRGRENVERRFRMNTDTYKEIMNLTRLTVGELREKYLEVFGEETRSHHKDFLRKRIARRLQAIAEGGLSKRARRRS